MGILHKWSKFCEDAILQKELFNFKHVEISQILMSYKTYFVRLGHKYHDTTEQNYLMDHQEILQMIQLELLQVHYHQRDWYTL